MKTYLTILLLLLTSIGFAQKDQSTWKGEFDFGDGFSMTTFLKVNKDQNQVLITSPKNADIRLVGGFNARLGRLFGKSPKKGIVLRIESEQRGDSLFGIARLPMLGELEFIGVINDDELSGSFLKDDNSIGRLISVKTQEERIDYTYLYPKILKITEDNIYSKKVLETKEWRKFQKQLKGLCSNAQDDIELFLGFNMMVPKLPFSHYNLFINNENTETTELNQNEPSVFFEEKTIETAYLEIRNFSTSEAELAAILPKIVENKNLRNLIIDLRNNGGGGIEAASVFSEYLNHDFIEVGYFPTNKLDYSGYDRKLFETLPESRPKTTDGFISELKVGQGAKLVIPKTDKEVFKGRIFILTSNNTASTCEPIVYVLKNNKRATIVGERTAGAMLSATYFEISGKYKLVLPLADFYTYDGIRIDQVGVEPDFHTSSDKALDKALELFASNE